jgi:hypothetical protein
MPECVVSFLDIDGLRHTVEVEATTLYEAAVLAICKFNEHGWPPGDLSRLEIEVRSSITHTVTPNRVRQWLDGGAKTPKEAVMKHHLRDLLS